ncbi:MAG: hypothetical protein FWH10_00570, partial [Oscillospiraceae bacterium]|nr:hypothetical protein [Oscillospiraceae bacterium]
MAKILTMDGTSAVKLKEPTNSRTEEIMGELRDAIKKDVLQENERYEDEVYRSRKIIENMEKQIKNIRKIQEYSKLKENWDFEGAQPFSKELIALALDKILGLNIQPKVFPTVCECIQFEYEKPNGDYLEFEIYEKKIEVFRIIESHEEEL